jgi:7,8-dihydropterin-6-yl-methyl-4-(beta-D-ribofuranosyl)aminobenzene 5'-phosphate synthase
MEVKIAILTDNITGPPYFKAEHGLSCFLEVDGRRFLWDCGLTDVALGNASILGIDLRTIEGIGLSHGHMDHAGGLEPVLRVAGPKKVYMHPRAYEPRFLVAGNTKVFAGIPLRGEALEAMSAGLVLSSGPIEVLPGVRLTGEIPRVTDFEGEEPYLFLLQDGELVPDPFVDDQALVIDTPDGAVVLTGCAHSGLVNILKHVMDGHGRVRAVIGGTHLGMGAPLDKVEKTMDFLEEVVPDKIIVNHCTGSVVMSRMLDRFGDRFIPGNTGLVVSF